MSSRDVSVLLCSAVLGILVPWAGMKMLVPSLSQGPLVENYRGRRVFTGLGIAWLIWGGAVAVIGVLASTWGRTPALVALVLAGPLAVAAFSFGLVDDAFGTTSDRGFRGHLAAASRGRLSTGGLKLAGISFASYGVAYAAYGMAPWVIEGQAMRFALAVPAGAAIALTANLTNLTDLRPGRALKVYSVLAALGVAFIAARTVLVSGPADVSTYVDLFALAGCVSGPVVAVWRYDVGESGMLGDAGANPAGAVAGTLVVLGLPVWLMLVYLAVVFALNMASERVSFTRVIEDNRLLHRLDMVGREKGPEPWYGSDGFDAHQRGGSE